MEGKEGIAKFREWIKRDWMTISILLMALIICIYVLASVQEFQNQCNEFWIENLEQIGCGHCVYGQQWNKTYSLGLPIEGFMEEGGG